MIWVTVCYLRRFQQIIVSPVYDRLACYLKLDSSKIISLLNAKTYIYIYICLNKCTFSADNMLKTAKRTWQYTALNKRIMLLAKRTTFYEQSTNIEKKREITFKPMLEKGYNHSLHRIHTCHHGKEILVDEQWFSIHL